MFWQKNTLQNNNYIVKTISSISMNFIFLKEAYLNNNYRCKVFMGTENDKAVAKTIKETISFFSNMLLILF